MVGALARAAMRSMASLWFVGAASCSLLAPPDEDLVGVRPNGSSGDAGTTGSYRDEVNLDGPIAYFALDESPGAAEAIDSVGGRSALPSENVAFGEAPLVRESGAAARLDFAYLDVGVDPTLSFEGLAPFSIELWARLGAFDQDPVYIAECGSEEVGGASAYKVFNVDGRLEFERMSRTIAVMDDYLESEVLTHIVVVWDGDESRIYRDGVLAIEQKPPDPLMMTSAGCHYRWGGMASLDQNNLFVGVLDELAIYDTALRATRIEDHYAAGRPP